MTHLQLINFFSQFQTQRIKPLIVEKCCSPNSIPEKFGQSIKDVFEVIENNFDELSNGKPIIGVLGLQCSGIKNKTKIANACCSLLYLPVTQNELNKITDWSDVKNLVIDFAEGRVLSPEQYVSEVSKAPDIKGKVYGRISALH